MVTHRIVRYRDIQTGVVHKHGSHFILRGEGPHSIQRAGTRAITGTVLVRSLPRGSGYRYQQGVEDMGEEIRDSGLKGDNPREESRSKADSTVIIVVKGLNSGGSPRFVDSDDMNPSEPMILRDPDDKGLIRRYWRRKGIKG